MNDIYIWLKILIAVIIILAILAAIWDSVSIGHW